MNTLDQQHPAAISASVKTGLGNWMTKQILKFEKERFGWMVMYIIVQSCLGSVACMYILQNHGGDILLASCASITMGCNAILIAQAPGKWCLASFYLSVFINLLFIFINV